MDNLRNAVKNMLENSPLLKLFCSIIDVIKETKSAFPNPHVFVINKAHERQYEELTQISLYNYIPKIIPSLLNNILELGYIFHTHQINNGNIRTSIIHFIYFNEIGFTHKSLQITRSIKNIKKNEKEGVMEDPNFAISEVKLEDHPIQSIYLQNPFICSKCCKFKSCFSIRELESKFKCETFEESVRS